MIFLPVGILLTCIGIQPGSDRGIVRSEIRREFLPQKIGGRWKNGAEACKSNCLILAKIQKLWRLLGKGFREGQGASWCRPSSKVLAAPSPPPPPLRHYEQPTAPVQWQPVDQCGWCGAEEPGCFHRSSTASKEDKASNISCSSCC